MDSLGSYVRQRRIGLGLTVTALAELAGMSKSQISAIENGRISFPGADKRRSLAKALGVRHIDLLVAAGELRPEELPIEGETREPFAPGDPRLPVQEALESLKPDNEVKRWGLEQVAHMLRNMQETGDV